MTDLELYFRIAAFFLFFGGIGALLVGWKPYTPQQEIDDDDWIIDCADCANDSIIDEDNWLRGLHAPTSTYYSIQHTEMEF